MKKVLLALLVLIPATISAQWQTEVINEVCGARFGDPFETAKVKLQDFFENGGKPAAERDTSAIANLFRGLVKKQHKPIIIGDQIQYMFEEFEGIRFENLYFSFDDKGRFSNASFWIYCESKKEAREKLTEVADILKLKHILYEGTDEDGVPIYGGGFRKPDSGEWGLLLSLEKKDVVLFFRNNE